MADTAQLLVNVYDGAREPLGGEIEWMARLADRRPLAERKIEVYAGLRGSSKLFTVPFFDNFFDDYSVVVTAGGFQDSGWFPVRVHRTAPAPLDLMLLPKEFTLNFAQATWARLCVSRRSLADVIQRGRDAGSVAEAYGAVLERRPKALACFLNIMAALAQIQLPSKRSPTDYYWNLAWPQGDCGATGWLEQLDGIFKQDRFFCYADAALVADLQAAARQGSFAPEPNPGAFHPDATESYKQTQFDVSNVQLTIHGYDTHTLPGPDGQPVPCVKIEADIDYYKDLGAHGILEVIPNLLTKGLTEPAIAYMLRWMAGRRAGLPFNPFFTVEPA